MAWDMGCRQRWEICIPFCEIGLCIYVIAVLAWHAISLFRWLHSKRPTRNYSPLVLGKKKNCCSLQIPKDDAGDSEQALQNLSRLHQAAPAQSDRLIQQLFNQTAQVVHGQSQQDSVLQTDGQANDEEAVSMMSSAADNDSENINNDFLEAFSDDTAPEMESCSCVSIELREEDTLSINCCSDDSSASLSCCSEFSVAQDSPQYFYEALQDLAPESEEFSRETCPQSVGQDSSPRQGSTSDGSHGTAASALDCLQLMPKEYGQFGHVHGPCPTAIADLLPEIAAAETFVIDLRNEKENGVQEITVVDSDNLENLVLECANAPENEPIQLELESVSEISDIDENVHVISSGSGEEIVDEIAQESTAQDGDSRAPCPVQLSVSENADPPTNPKRLSSTETGTNTIEVCLPVPGDTAENPFCSLALDENAKADAVLEIGNDESQSLTQILGTEKDVQVNLVAAENTHLPGMSEHAHEFQIRGQEFSEMVDTVHGKPGSDENFNRAVSETGNEDMAKEGESVTQDNLVSDENLVGVPAGEMCSEIEQAEAENLEIQETPCVNSENKTVESVSEAVNRIGVDEAKIVESRGAPEGLINGSDVGLVLAEGTKIEPINESVTERKKRKEDELAETCKYDSRDDTDAAEEQEPTLLQTRYSESEAEVETGRKLKLKEEDVDDLLQLRLEALIADMRAARTKKLNEAYALSDRLTNSTDGEAPAAEIAAEIVAEEEEEEDEKIRRHRGKQQQHNSPKNTSAAFTNDECSTSISWESDWGKSTSRDSEYDHDLRRPRQLSLREPLSLQSVYERYTQQMRHLDLIIHHHMQEALGLAQPKYLTRSRSLRMPSTLRRLSSRRERTVDDMVLQQNLDDMELLYVSQTCFSWEALQWQYKKVQHMAFSTSAEHSRSYHRCDQEFQHFQIHIQNFLENEPYQQGPRSLIYLRTRCQFPLLLQVPLVQESTRMTRTEPVQEENEITIVEEEEEEENVITALHLATTMEDCISKFMDFVKEDKGKNPALVPNRTMESKDLHRTKLIKKTAHKKMSALQELRRKRHGLRRKRRKSEMQKEESAEILMSIVDAMLILRVLRMPTLNQRHLHWCESKLNKINVVNGKVIRDCTPLFFPHA